MTSSYKSINRNLDHHSCLKSHFCSPRPPARSKTHLRRGSVYFVKRFSLLRRGQPDGEDRNILRSVKQVMYISILVPHRGSATCSACAGYPPEMSVSTDWSARPPPRELLSKILKDSAPNSLLEIEVPDLGVKGLRHLCLAKLTKAHSMSATGRVC